MKAVPLLKQLGVDLPDPEKSFKDIDKNGGGIILFDEFCEFAIKTSLDLEDDEKLE